jgi:hypothetical protein
MDQMFRYLDGDRIKVLGQQVTQAGYIDVRGTSDESQNIQNYVNAGKRYGRSHANLFEYMNQFGHANKRNVVMINKFTNILDSTGIKYPLRGAWHFTKGSEAGISDVLYIKDSINVLDPLTGITSNECGFTCHALNSGDNSWQTPLAGNTPYFTKKLHNLNCENAIQFVKERSKAFIENYAPELKQRNVEIVGGYTNITSEENLNHPDLKSMIQYLHPFVTENLGPIHSPPDGSPHNSINPWQPAYAPFTGPEEGFIAFAGSPTNPYANLMQANGNINPRNQYYKNWLKAHRNGTTAERNALNYLFSYSYAKNINNSNIDEYIDREHALFTDPKGVDNNIVNAPNSVYRGGTYFGVQGFHEQGFYAKVALNTLGSKIYEPITKYFSGNNEDGVTGFPNFNLMNYISYNCEPKERGPDSVGYFEYDDSIPFDPNLNIDFSGDKYQNCDTLGWYGQIPQTDITGSWRIQSSFIREKMAAKWKIKNYIKNLIPQKVLQGQTSTSSPQGITVYDNLAQKTLPFWSIVYHVNNMKSLLRCGPDRKKAVWFSNFQESSNTIRDRFYRPELNIHGLLVSSDDAVNAYFNAGKGIYLQENSIQNASREVNKVLQHNRKRFIFEDPPYSWDYMAPQYLNKGPTGNTYANMLQIPPLVTCVEFGGNSGQNYPYVACRVTLPLPTNFNVQFEIQGEGQGFAANLNTTKHYDIGATLSSGEVYPNFPPPIKVAVTFGDNTTGIYSPGPYRSAGFWIVGENNNKFRNMQFRLTLEVSGETGACCGPTGDICLGITNIAACSALGGYFRQGTTCSACSLIGQVPQFEILP